MKPEDKDENEMLTLQVTIDHNLNSLVIFTRFASFYLYSQDLFI
jgi:hypothetical protein